MTNRTNTYVILAAIAAASLYAAPSMAANQNQRNCEAAAISAGRACANIANKAARNICENNARAQLRVCRFAR